MAGTLGVDDFSLETGGQFNHLTIYPNPVENNAKLSLYLAQTSKVTVEVLDVSGRKLKETKHDKMGQGKNEIELDLSNLKSGNYLYRVTVSNANGDFSQTKKLIKK